MRNSDGARCIQNQTRYIDLSIMLTIKLKRQKFHNFESFNFKETYKTILTMSSHRQPTFIYLCDFCFASS